MAYLGTCFLSHSGLPHRLFLSVRLTVYPYLGDEKLLQRVEKEKKMCVLILKSPSLRPKERSSRGTIDDRHT